MEMRDGDEEKGRTTKKQSVLKMSCSKSVSGCRRPLVASRMLATASPCRGNWSSPRIHPWQMTMRYRAQSVLSESSCAKLLRLTRSACRAHPNFCSMGAVGLSVCATRGRAVTNESAAASRAT